MIIGAVAVVGLGLAGVFIVGQASQKAYACSNIFDPSPSPQSGRLGEVQPDQGRTHLARGEAARYTLCPPASGPHYNAAGAGPIQPRYYAPEANVLPQAWVHNLEHGALVILYRPDTASDTAAHGALRELAANFPPSPVCGLAGNVVGSPVIARFDELPHPYAALVWGRVLYQDALDVDEILEFFRTEAERGNPEPLCAPPSPSPTPSPSTSLSPAASPSPSAEPSPSPTPTPGPS
ncbi:MAG: hypothetical protein KatS3mg065_1216 [Chloroflexota bacterium]|nr:MAG: hypothetical protein KatS3mg065_1216 [Chloroflexota bacterium]